MDRVLAAAEHLRSEGKYSDGIGRTERIYVAGHSAWRLSDEFVNAPQIVGNDEQYAATMALIANDIGVPARVVLGAVVPGGRSGHRQGRRRPGWSSAPPTGRGSTLPTEAFMSDTPPADQVPETNTPMSGTVIPPPNPIPPPSDAGEQSDADLKERKATRKKKAEEDEDGIIPGLPSWVGTVVTYVGLPAARSPPCCWPPSSASRRGVGTAAAARPRPRPASWAPGASSSTTPATWASSCRWGRRSPGASSRSASCPAQAGTLARRADSFVFGPSTPEVAAAATYWESVDAERRAMSQRGRPLAAPPGRDQPPLAAAYDVPAGARRRSAAGHRRHGPTPAPGRVPAGGATAARRSLIGVLDVRLTKLVRRPNVGCVSWRLAAARNLVRSSQTLARVPGKRFPGPPHEVHRPPACRCRAVPGPR